MRINHKDIIFDDDIDVQEDKKEINGYLWATDKLVKMIGFEGDINCDEYVNFYANYNYEKDKWYVDASEYIWEKEKYKNKIIKLEFTEEELDFIADKFIEYYFGSKENFNDYIEELKKGR